MNKEAEKIWQKLRSYESEVFGFLKRSLGDGETARDLFQEVYLKALENIDRLDADRSLKNWLLTVARNRVINYYRDKSRRQFESINENHIVDAGHDDEIEEGAVQFALKALPERQKRIFLKRELDGLNYNELSSEFGLTPAAVNSLLNRARSNFKKHYQLYFLPDWVKKNSGKLPVEDLLRFIHVSSVHGDVVRQAHEKSQRFFSDIRHEWDKLRERFFPEERLREIFNRLGSLENKIILDAGSGAGMIAVKAALRAKRVFAAEINPSMIRQLRMLKEKLVLRNLIIIRNDIRRFCFKPQSADAVFATLVLHHLPRPEIWLKETAAVLKKGGRLVIVDFDRHGNKQLADMMHDLWLGFPPDLVKRWANQAQLELVDSRTWNSEEGIPVYYQIYEK
ncbi:MAG: sigma-70 family RNA polymerase sigma factor [Calditrichaeota bacterium]|nr:sigma-70 family RNA polymerase sigma factor [Calditrichota bacterium]